MAPETANASAVMAAANLTFSDFPPAGIQRRLNAGPLKAPPNPNPTPQAVAPQTGSIRACMLINEKTTISPARPQPNVATSAAVNRRRALMVLLCITSAATSPPSGNPKSMAGKARKPAAAMTPANPKLTVARIRLPPQPCNFRPEITAQARASFLGLRASHSNTWCLRLIL